MLNEFWLRADSEDAAFRGDETRMLPSFDRLVAEGILKRGEDLIEIDCDACGDAHLEDVMWITEPAGSVPRAYIGCPISGRVRVELERLHIWKIELTRIVDIAAQVFEIDDSPRMLEEGRLWLLGTRAFGNRLRDVFIIRGADWNDREELLAKCTRLAASPGPLLLVPNLIPEVSAGTLSRGTLLSMSEFDWFGKQGQDTLRKVICILEEHDRGILPAKDYTFRKEGQYWTVTFGGKTIRMNDSKGLFYLSRLLAQPGRDFQAVELVAAAKGRKTIEVRSSAGQVLDDEAMRQYKARAIELDVEIKESRADNDIGRTEKLLSELEVLSEQLAAAKGLGARRRVVGDTQERARKAVGEALKRTLTNFKLAHPALAKHLKKYISPGSSLSYAGSVAWFS